VVLGTWNLENLLRPPSENGPTGERAYDAKLTELARVIGELAPDVLGVQEVGGPGPLEDLRKRLGGDWQAASSELPGDRGIRVGFLSRLAMDEITHVGEFPEPLAPVQVADDGSTIDAMGRGAMRVRVRIGGRDVDVVNCHLKSKLLSFPRGFSPEDEAQRARYGAYALYRRAAEAATVRAYADELLEGQGRERAVVVLGDLNDVPSAATTQMLLGPPGSEIGTQGFEGPDKGDGSRLWNLAPLIPEERRFSRRFRGRGELIDHLLVSHALVTAVEQVDTRAGEPPSITEDPRERRDEPASDHLPLIARFRPA